MAQIHFSVKGLIIKDKKFLVLHKVSPRCEYFDLPGGKMKNNESAEETLQREILEETSLLIKPISVLHQWDFVNQDYLIMGIIYASLLQKKYSYQKNMIIMNGFP